MSIDNLTAPTTAADLHREGTEPVITVGSTPLRNNLRPVLGDFVEIDGEDYYQIQSYDNLPPFLISLVSATDHWMFISSTGAQTAGRKSPEHSLFPYYTEDKIHDSQQLTGSKTIFLVSSAGNQKKVFDGNGTHQQWLWEPFSDRYSGIYTIRRNLYKSLHGDKLRFEEINDDLGLNFAVTWCTGDRFGFVKRATLENNGTKPVSVRALDGMRNLMSFGVDQALQNWRSVLADAYKINELLSDTGLGLFTVGAQPVDKAEPSEALKATTVWAAGMAPEGYLLSTRQLNRFRMGHPLKPELLVRAERGAHFVYATFELNPDEAQNWLLVADIEQDAADIIALNTLLENPASLLEEVERDICAGTEGLRRLVGGADGIQCTGDRMATARHYMNVLFNIMRGGVFDDGYFVDRDEFKAFVFTYNKPLARAKTAALDALPQHCTIETLLEALRANGPDLERLSSLYLPLVFSRRHGDPSRPWNHFSIDIRNDDGSVRRSYEGNWRDIFQNWEALSVSFPEYLESMIAQFVDASTADGYNPYRMTDEGFEWEVLDPDDPWSHIGYWGDHQIVYLLKLLELSTAYHPGRLEYLLSRKIFAYANIPYRIKSYADILSDPHNTIDYDIELEEQIEQRVESVGADGKLLWDSQGAVYHVTLTEKLLVPLLAKLTNFIPGGGIWMNTQRPDWNDANNALVGYGISMVTLFQLRSYVIFLGNLFAKEEKESFELSEEVADLMDSVSARFDHFSLLDSAWKTDWERKRMLDALGMAGCAFRGTLYAHDLSGQTRAVSRSAIVRLTVLVQAFIDETIDVNRRRDGLFNTYNILQVEEDGIAITPLHLMLEGQVAALDSGVVSPIAALDVLEALRTSALYREDQHSYMLYPDRTLPRFLEKNVIPAEAVPQIELLQRLIDEGDRSLVIQDVGGSVHFNGSFRNSNDVEEALDELRNTGVSGIGEAEYEQVLDLFEQVFNHRSYTGRSGTFFGYEGLGSIYWHMVSKLILAVQKICFRALDEGADPDVQRRLADAYYDLRSGLGLNKTPQEYGAFPIDAYSHTPGESGAKQPGMTGQVKEDILCRWGELGLRVVQGQIIFTPVLLRDIEFMSSPTTFRYVDVHGAEQVLALEADSLAFTYAQVPVVYYRSFEAGIRIVKQEGTVVELDGASIDSESSAELFHRTGRITRIEVDLMPTR